MKELHKISLVLIALMLVSSIAYAAVDCTKDDHTKHPRYTCLYDKPGGVKLVGPGREVIDSYRTVFEDGLVRVQRQVEVVRLGSIGYANPNSAVTTTDVAVSYLIQNFGKEDAAGMKISQDVDGGLAYSLSAGTVKAGRNATVNFSFPADLAPSMPDPEIYYVLPSVSLKGAETEVNEKMDLWLKVGKLPLSGEEVQVTTPSGSKIMLLTEKSGLAEFTPREVGPYLVSVPRRELVKPVYIYATQSYVPPKPEAAGKATILGAASALLVGGASSTFGLLGAPGIGLVFLMLLIGGWTFYRARGRHDSEESAIVGGDVPSELARYGAEQHEYAAGLPAEAVITSEPLAMSEEEKLKMMESTIMLSPKQMDDIHSREARRALGGGQTKKGQRKAKGGREEKDDE